MKIATVAAIVLATAAMFIATAATPVAAVAHESAATHSADRTQAADSPTAAKDAKDATDKDAKERAMRLFNPFFILILAGFLGFEVITRVSPLLHTPLMSATNAISGISLVGSLVAAGNTGLGPTANILGFIAVTAATINVVGGFMITDRMLRMFKTGKGK